MTTTTTPAEVRLSGTLDDELRMTMWSCSADDGEPVVLVRFEIVSDHDLPDDPPNFIEVPLDAVLPLVLALAGSYEHHSTGGRPRLTTERETA